MSKHYQTFEGEDNPLYKRVEYDCDYCDQTMERKPSRLDYHDYLFCSTECREAHYEECDEYIQKQENEKCEIECEICGTVFEVAPYRKDTATYCSTECRIEYTKQLTGKDHPLYKPDKPESNFYNCEAWQETREEALEQAGHKCEACGSEEDLVGHHVVPLSAGGEPFDTQNVSILCRTCHGEWEGLFLAPDNRR
jgi:5-methylcytosine-specific restriction endonuclease McrA